jgi:molybdate transport system substrate-binding protein
MAKSIVRDQGDCTGTTHRAEIVRAGGSGAGKQGSEAAQARFVCRQLPPEDQGFTSNGTRGKTVKMAFTSLARARFAAGALTLVAALLGCSRPASDNAAPAAATPPAAAAAAPSAPAPGGAAGASAKPTPAAGRKPVIVFAASSLTDAFNDLEKSFEASNPDADVASSFGGSQVLKLQITQGAPADVFASADEAHMQELIKAGGARSSQTFAENELVLLVPEDNPAHIDELKQLPRAKRLVIGAANVPVGAYTRQLLTRANASYGPSFEKDVLSHVVSEESNVRLVRTKVELGEADAAIVYRTDAIGAKKVKLIEVPPALNVRGTYPIAVLSKAPEPALAQRWVDYVRSADGRAALAARGFLVEK